LLYITIKKYGNYYKILLKVSKKFSTAKHNSIFLKQMKKDGKHFMKPLFLPSVDKDTDIKPELLE